MRASMCTLIRALVALITGLGAVTAWGQASIDYEITMEGLAEELQITQQQLAQTQRRLDELGAQRDLARTTEAKIVPVGHRVNTSGDCCPDCGKTVCQGMPHLCGLCLEKLSWNKGGGWRIVPFGRLRGEAIYSEEPNTGEAVVVFLNPNEPNIDQDITTVHAKQSQLAFAISGPSVGDYQANGTVLINFMGAQPLRNFSGANIVLAFAEFKNNDWRFSFGRMLDLFGPINPTTVNQIGQRGAGNVGIYRGAFNIDRYITYSDQLKWTLSTRIGQQDITDYASVPTVNGKDNGWPNIEARFGVELGTMRSYGRPLEIGLSGVVGEVQAVAPSSLAVGGGIVTPAIDEIAQTRGVALDLQLKGERVGFRGEAFWARAAGTYFAGVLQSLNPETAQAIESLGGWGEVYFRCNPCVTMHGGFGVDDPRNGGLGFINRTDVGIGQISYNEVAWWNTIWNVTPAIELAFEISHRRTRFLDIDSGNDGMLFHTASTWKF